MRRMIPVTLLAILLSITVAYQNCGQRGLNTDPENASETENEYQSKDVIIGSTEQISKIVYHSNLEFPEMSQGTPHLTVEPPTGKMELRTQSPTGPSLKTCIVDDDRLIRMRDLLQDGKICEPGPLPPGLMTCMAISVSDIRLEIPNSEPISLRQPMCHNGTYLCDQRDKEFRILLKDLVQVPPAGCL